MFELPVIDETSECAMVDAGGGRAETSGTTFWRLTPVVDPPIGTRRPLRADDGALGIMYTSNLAFSLAARPAPKQRVMIRCS